MDEKNDYEATITINDLLRSIKKNIILFIIISISVFIIGLIYTLFIVKPTYKASTSIIVAIENQSDSNNNIDYTNSLKIIETIAQFTKEDIVLEPVSKKHNIPLDSLRKMITTSTSSSKYIYTITIINEDSILSGILANDIYSSLKEQINNNEAIKKFNVTVDQTSKALNGSYNSPNKTLYIAISFLLGIFISSIIIFLMELLSNKYKDKKQIETSINENILGVIYNNKKAQKEIIPNNLNLLEPFNRIATNIKFSDIENKYKTILITSTVMNELKTTVCANLAYSLVFNNKKVCIIDLDLRKPCLHKVFNVSKENGIVDYLNNNLSKEDIIKKLDCGIDIITIGQDVINPLAILESEKLKDLIDELKLEYDYIILDSAPVITTDSFVAAKLADGIIYNIALNQAKKKTIIESLYELKKLGNKIIGTVITKAYLDKNESYYYQKSK